MPDQTILETAANGDLQIPACILGAGPGARFRVEREGAVLRLVPESPSPAERARAFLEWVSQIPERPGPPIPADALRRENLYE